MDLEKRISVLEKKIQGQKKTISLMVVCNISTTIVIMTLSNRLNQLIEILDKTITQLVDLTL